MENREHRVDTEIQVKSEYDFIFIFEPHLYFSVPSMSSIPPWHIFKYQQITVNISRKVTVNKLDISTEIVDICRLHFICFE